MADFQSFGVKDFPVDLEFLGNVLKLFFLVSHNRLKAAWRFQLALAIRNNTDGELCLWNEACHNQAHASARDEHQPVDECTSLLRERFTLDFN
jgi:hypothetical protein